MKICNIRFLQGFLIKVFKFGSNLNQNNANNLAERNIFLLILVFINKILFKKINDIFFEHTVILAVYLYLHVREKKLQIIFGTRFLFHHQSARARKYTHTDFFLVFHISQVTFFMNI